MKKTMLYKIDEALTRNAVFPAHKTYYLFAGKWREIDGAEIEAALAGRLQTALDSDTSKSSKSNNDLFIPNREFAMVVRLEIGKRIRQETIKKFRDLFQISLSQAKYEYMALHDSLTGLINGREFDEKSNEAISKLSNQIIETTENAIGNNAQAIVSVLIDIDHFKQVNDTFGHEYGDIVLYCFARRIESNTIKLSQIQSRNWAAIVGRCGGEEFKILLSGSFTLKDVTDFCEENRKLIEASILPNLEEWEAVPAEMKPRNLDLPHESQRKITCSIGISKVIRNKKDDTRSAAKEIQREADQALYRAKTSGRNAVRCFSNIKDDQGVVIKVHTQTKFIAIDIGSNVGVKRGDEFLWYNPDFIGGIPFLVNDGRSIKRLGHYPRLKSGKIKVIEVQKDISFCLSSDESKSPEIVEGSKLEYIPIGSIEALYRDDFDRYGGEIISDLPRMNKFFIDEALPNKLRASLSIYLANIEDVEAKNPAFRVNQRLNELIELLKQCPGYKFFNKTNSSLYTFAFEIQSDADFVKTITDSLNGFEQKLPDFFKIDAGIYLSSQVFEEFPDDKSILDNKHAVQYSIFAATGQPFNAETIAITKFKPSSATYSLYRLRKNGKYQEAIADYKLIKECGIDNGGLENQIALCLYENRPSSIEQAQEYAKRACELLPSDKYIRANYASILASLGKWDETIEIFGEMITTELIKGMGSGYYFQFAWSLYLKSRRGDAINDIPWVIHVLKDYLGSEFGISQGEIDLAITELSSLEASLTSKVV